jgi:YegS/Rv2252/BmrU family lipid kinase
VLDRPARVQLIWAAASLALFGLVVLLVVRERTALTAFDREGRALAVWAAGHEVLTTALHGIELTFSTIPMTVYTVVAAGLLLWRGHPRAAIFTVAVMGTTALLTTVIKLWLGRDRPAWQSATDMLTTQSFPSGHSSSAAAFGGILMVLALMLVRRTALRRLVYALALLMVLVVGLDRVLLGRHYPTDAIGGWLLGATVVLVGVAIVNPLPRPHAEKVAPLVESVPSARRLAVVLNPAKVESVGQFRALVTSMAAEAGWAEPRWFLTSVDDPGRGMAHSAAVAGADLVIVCGGDGTVREVCAELAGTGIPVGIVPAGTGNLLARNLDIPLYLRSAVDVALTGQDRAIDLVAVSGDGIEDSHFMVMAGMGFDAAIMEGVNEGLKRRVGWVAYVGSALRSLMFPAVKVEITVDDDPPSTHRARTVVVGNVGYLQAGMPLLPDAAIDDGQLDLVLLHPRRFLSWIPLAARVLSRGRRTDETINRMTGRRISVRAAADTPRQLDGDSVGVGRELHMECLPGRLLVRVPR